MNVFEFRERLVAEYGRFSRSFCKIRAGDIGQFVNDKYAKENFWPSPIIQLNPNFKVGGEVNKLVDQGLLEPECARVFALHSNNSNDRTPLNLYQHQVDAIRAARDGHSYVLTTGTGSGKSLAYFIPIVNDVLRRRRLYETGPKITAIVVYPMNALCNSQLEELQRFLGPCDKNNSPVVSYARYTGQDSEEHRQWVASNPPDILLTNYVMLELLMTRFNETDKSIRRHAKGLRYLVLDELHTYRGRQGADVAMLVRRVRERFNMDLQCVGTSATMSSGEEDPSDRTGSVADVASRLFGTTVRTDHVITETLTPVTNRSNVPAGPKLRELISNGVSEVSGYRNLQRHPFASWVEWVLGLEGPDEELVRIQRPLTVKEAVDELSSESGLDKNDCARYLTRFLLSAYTQKDEQGRSLFAFRLHQFISGAWSVFTTLEAPEERYLTLEGQQYVPGDRNRRLYSLCFCRQCGQEYIPVWASRQGKQLDELRPRDLTERSHDDDNLQSGFVLIDPENPFNVDNYSKNYPEDWVEIFRGAARLKRSYLKYRPIAIKADTLGQCGESGTAAWYIPGAFRFCLAEECDAYYSGRIRSDLTKLSSLSSEGRSSATTILTLSVLKQLIEEQDLGDSAKKLLAFTDNRQDASLQAGHFNDFIQVLLLRSALLAAVAQADNGQIRDDTVAALVLDKLNLTSAQYAANKDLRGPAEESTRRTLLDVLGYRIYRDLERGWRINNPNLEQLGLLEIRYRGLKTCCEDEEVWAQGHSLLASTPPEKRLEIAKDLLERMRKALCIKTIYLDEQRLERLRDTSYSSLNDPWGLEENEVTRSAKVMLPRSRRGRQSHTHFYLSHLSDFGRSLKSAHRWGDDNPHFVGNIDKETYAQVVDALLRALGRYGLVEAMPSRDKQPAYQINASVLQWRFPKGGADSDGNTFFRNLYLNTSRLLSSSENFLHKIEAREHTAQVESDDRVTREARFRKGMKGDGLPVLFCSPTMELGVDIATLNTVYMRNVPPTPANYVQRGGRAGRSGQPALVITYCAARSPHDQYFFQDPPRMVSGQVMPPSIDLANEDLIRSHLHAVWLSESGVKLGGSVRELMDLAQADQPLYEEYKIDLGRPAARERAMIRASKILDTIKDDLIPSSAPWYTETWLKGALNSVLKNFDDALGRWRSLYQATVSHMQSARRVLDNAAAAHRDREEAKRRHDEAYRQQQLLLSNRNRQHSDFGTYRYLAAQGFLPGYNFPRLPLMAFIPGSRVARSNQSVLSRPRFIGLSEFGPQSFIYHEGSTYRVSRAMLSIDDAAGAATNRRLPVHGVVICPECGYGHFGEEKDSEVCVRCNSQHADARRIHNLYRIEQVSTRRVNRITSDEEERQRQGYEMITTYKYASKDNYAQVFQYRYELNDRTIVELEYGPAATLWRINLGWRRRREPTIYGFNVDPTTGMWSRNEQAPTDAEDDLVKGSTNTERITPYVEDTKNVLVVKPHEELSTDALTTLQFALKRGIEAVYQLEGSELAAEPLPDSSNRNAILLYEASEGGAGVLTRLASDADALANVARYALELCHYVPSGGQWSDSKSLVDQSEECEAGCYQCLLSYYNQFDHAKIDRKDKSVLSLLCRLIAAHQTPGDNEDRSGQYDEEICNLVNSPLEKEWLAALRNHGYRLPDRIQPLLKDFNTQPDFAYSQAQAVIYIDGPHHDKPTQRAKDKSITASLESAGFTVVRFGYVREKWLEIFKSYAWIFGPGSSNAKS